MRKEKVGQVITVIMLMAVVLTIYMSWMGNILFTDEQDVFYGGYNVVMSGDIYKNYASQHMPVSYYLAAVGALLGARTVYQFRLFFYVLLTLLWALIWLRNRKDISRTGLFLLPALYLFMLKNYSYATTMVSDHWQGIGLVMILLELIRFADTKKITGGTCGMVALGIVLSFGSAFLSAYAIFIVMLGVMIVLIREGRKHPEGRQSMWKGALRLMVCCLAPFLALAGWYLISGNWSNFVDGAYRINVEEYAKYTSNYSNTVGGSLGTMLPAWIQNMETAILGMGQNPWLSLMVCLQVICLALAVMRIWKKDRIIAVTFLLATLLSGIRAYSGFHAAPYLACCAVSIALCLGWLMDGGIKAFTSGWGKRKNSEAAKTGAGSRGKSGATALSLAAGRILLAVLIVLGLSVPSLVGFENLRYVPELIRLNGRSEGVRDLLEIVTEPGERIHTGDISITSNQVMAYDLRMEDASLASGNPWFYEVYGERALAALKENRTKILILYPEIPIWGFSMEDYASDLMAYVRENYTKLQDGIYVHHEALGEVSVRLRETGYGLIGTDLTAEGMIPWSWLHPGQTDEQKFVAAGSQIVALQLRMESVKEENQAGMTARLFDAEKGELIAECALSADELIADGWTRFPLNAATEPGKVYVIQMETQDYAGMTMLRTYRTLDDTATEEVYARVNGLDVNYNLAMRIEYAADDQCGILK